MNKSSVDDNKTTLFVQVILPLPLESFTYRVPFHLNEVIAIGQMVAVRFGRKAKKLYGGIVSSISEEAPNSFQAAYIQEIVDDLPLISTVQLQFWKWLARYYQTKLGDVMIAALPSGLRLSGETRIYSPRVAGHKGIRDFGLYRWKYVCDTRSDAERPFFAKSTKIFAIFI